MIFGLGSPQIYYDGTSVTLTHASIDNYDWMDLDQLEHKSVINGDKSLINNGAYANFTITENLYKYTSNPTPAEQWQKLYNAIGRDIIFRPHKDKVTASDGLGIAMQGSDGTAVNYWITEFKPFYVDNLTTKDAVKITFTAKKYVDISKNKAI